MWRGSKLTSFHLDLGNGGPSVGEGDRDRHKQKQGCATGIAIYYFEGAPFLVLLKNTPAISLMPGARRTFKFKPPHPLPNYRETKAQVELTYLRSRARVRVQAQPHSRPWNEAPSLALVWGQRSAETWMLVVRSLRVSRGFLPPGLGRSLRRAQPQFLPTPTPAFPRLETCPPGSHLGSEQE